MQSEPFIKLAYKVRRFVMSFIWFVLVGCTCSFADEWQSLRESLPAQGNESYEVDEYAKALEKLNVFCVQNSEDAHVAEARQHIARLEQEKKRVQAGELKLNGRWMSTAEIEDESAQIKAKALWNRMKVLNTTGRYIDALNLFSRLEKAYPGSASYPEAAKMARQLAESVKRSAEQLTKQIQQQAKQNEIRLSNASESEREQITALIQQQEEAAQKVIDSCKDDAWLPLTPSNEKSLAILIQKATETEVALAALPLEKMITSARGTESARAFIHSNNLQPAEDALKEAAAAWPQNEALSRLQAKLAEKQKAALAAKATTPVDLPEPQSARPPEEPGFFQQPLGWVILLVIFCFGIAVIRVYRKYRDPKNNILDQ
jgi:hypothetical protein